MTTDRIALEALIEKTPDADFLREMIAFAADRLMALEVDGLCGAGHGERNAERSNHRNGYRERAWETRAGAITLPIPKHHFHLYLKECEWRFNYRPTANLLKVLTQWAKM